MPMTTMKTLTTLMLTAMMIMMTTIIMTILIIANTAVMIMMTTMMTTLTIKMVMISNSNWTEWSTIQGVIGRVISKSDLKILARLLPELYDTKSNY